ncbi:MAG: GspE/PulE family protein, partial [Microcystaceae cyanobacterium]
MDTPTTTTKKTPTRAVALRNYFSPFGNKLIAAGHADADQLRKALIQVKTEGKSLPQAIAAVTGKALTPELAREYKKNYLFELKVLYGVDSLDPEIRPIANQEMAELLQELRFSIENCRRYRILPLAKQAGDPPSVLVAMVDPDDLAAQDELQRILKFNGLELRRLVITQEDFDQLVEQYYAIRGQIDKAHEKDQEKRDKEKEVEQLSDVTDILGSFEGGLSDAPEENTDAQLDSKDANKAPVISLVNKILAKAIQEGTSDIHVEPQETTLRIRFRRDGILHQAFDPLPKKLINAVVARFKIMADMDIAERRAPQDG